MKKIFESVRQWTKKQIPDTHIKAVLETLAESGVYYPSDFTISLTAEQKENAQKANEELNEKTKSLFYEIDHSDWSEAQGENVATIIFGLVLSANGDTLKKEVKNKVKIKYDYKGGKADVEFVKGIEYPISLQRVEDIKTYLDTKVNHPFPEVMYEDIRHTKKFTDVPWGVLTHIVSYYHAYNGDVTSKDMLGYVKHKMIKEVPLNKRGANIDGGGESEFERIKALGKTGFKQQAKELKKIKKNQTLENEVTVAEFNKYFMRNYGFISHSLTNKQIEKFLQRSYIKEAPLTKKADLFQDYLLANGLADDVQLKKGANIKKDLPTKERKRLDVLQIKEDINELNKPEDKEYVALVKKYRKTDRYKKNQLKKHAKGGYVFTRKGYEFVPQKFVYEIGGL